MKKFFKVLLIIIAVILIISLVTVGGYFAYLFIAYHRVGNEALSVNNFDAAKEIETGKEYTLVSYNIGFGAYEPDFGFFMDGGTEARAWTKDRLDVNMKLIAEFLKEQNADFYFVQEVDTKADRSYDIDERTYLKDALEGMSYTFAQNFDSPYLFFPILRPHGAAKSGIMTFSCAAIEKADRVELPVETGFSKLFDLDRCYSKNVVKTKGGETLVLYNFHLSAYTSDGKIANEQLKLLLADMEAEYKKGCYCIAGGDFNKDILGDSSKYFVKPDKEYTWAQPIPEEILKNSEMRLIAPLDEANPIPTCRNADGPYNPNQFQLTIDGFLVSPNVEVTGSSVFYKNNLFEYSDHNPVKMTFKLVGELTIE